MGEEGKAQEMTAVFVKNFGCKTNYAESLDLTNFLRGNNISAGLASDADEVKELIESGWPPKKIAVVINSCTVTATAERKAAQYVNRMKNLSPDIRVIVTGCAARTEEGGERFRLKGAEVITTAEEVGELLKASHCDELNGFAEESFPLPSLFGEKRTREFLKVQDGCDLFCSYCIIPAVRSSPRSKEPRQVMETMASLLSKGAKEIVITGINLGNYAGQFDGVRLSLSGLLRSLLEILPPGRRIRVSSLEPQSVDDEILELLSHPGFCDHLHLPLQSGSERVLRDMKRRYDLNYYLSLVSRIHDHYPNVSITTDIIVGFPTENEQDFEETKRVVREVGFERVHIFPYSRRPSTEAADYQPLPGNIVHRRVSELKEFHREIGDSRREAQIGRDLEVLFETSGEGYAEGYSSNYHYVRAHNADRLGAHPRSSENGQVNPLPTTLAGSTRPLTVGEIREVLVIGAEGEILISRLKEGI